jgi:hypothetical protein
MADPEQPAPFWVAMNIQSKLDAKELARIPDRVSYKCQDPLVSCYNNTDQSACATMRKCPDCLRQVCAHCYTRNFADCPRCGLRVCRACFDTRTWKIHCLSDVEKLEELARRPHNS